MHIAFVASECVPFAKTGGLADVVGALPKALANLGHQVSVYIPRYRASRPKDAQTVVRSITVPFDDQYRFCSVVTGENTAGVRYYFVDYPAYFEREGLYGTPVSDYSDNAERFALFCRAVIEASKILGVPHVFHCHDWQSALVPVLLRTIYAQDPAFREVATLFTVHNIGYQGIFPPEILPLLMLPWDLFTIARLEFFGQVNFLKGALVMADMLTTVSRKYAQEIQTAEYGFGLEGVLRGRASVLTGILNGVDYDDWNPQTDRHIAAQYSAQDLSGKAKCKQDLLAEFGITNVATKLPVIGIVSRFAGQKGFDLIAQIMDRLAREEMIMVVLGSADPGPGVGSHAGREGPHRRGRRPDHRRLPARGRRAAGGRRRRCLAGARPPGPGSSARPTCTSWPTAPRLNPWFGTPVNPLDAGARPRRVVERLGRRRRRRRAESPSAPTPAGPSASRRRAAGPSG